MNPDRLKENRAQADALRAMRGDALELIDAYGAELRQIINEYEDMHGREPTGDDIIWLLSERKKKNLRESE